MLLSADRVKGFGKSIERLSNLFSSTARFKERNAADVTIRVNTGQKNQFVRSKQALLVFVVCLHCRLN